MPDGQPGFSDYRGSEKIKRKTDMTKAGGRYLKIQVEGWGKILDTRDKREERKGET
jgi:hypothetical protein